MHPSIRSAALDTVERPLAGAMKNPESFLVGAELCCIDMEFEEQAAVFVIAIKFADAAGGFGHSAEGADMHPFLVGIGLHHELPHCNVLPVLGGTVKKESDNRLYGNSPLRKPTFCKTALTCHNHFRI